MNLGKRLFIIYPGKFQPFHKGNKDVYDFLSTKYGGNDVYITTEDKLETLKNPFNFEEKVKMAVLTGIPLRKIVSVPQNYNTKNLIGKVPINVDRDSIIFAVTQKELDENPIFSNFQNEMKKTSYFEKLPKNLSKLEPAKTHGYIDIIPDTELRVFGSPIKSTLDLIGKYTTLTDIQKKLLIKDLFGKYDDTIMNILNNKLRGQISEVLNEKQKKILKKLIVGIMKEDEAKIKSARQKWNMAGLVLRNAELDAAQQELTKANDDLNAATTPEEKEKAKLNVQTKKDDVASKRGARDAAKHQLNT